MKYKVHIRSNSLDPNGKKFQYAIPVNAGKLTIRKIAEQIAGRSSLTRGDIENVLINFVEQFPVFLELGLSIQLGDFGTMRLSISSESVEEGTPFTTHNIKGARVIFTPSTEFKDALKRISYEEEKSPDAPVHEDEPETGGSGPVEE